MWSKTPAAGGSWETQSTIAEGHGEGGGIIDRSGGRARHRGAAADGAGEHGFVHSPHVAIHCVGSRGRALVLFAGAGASSAGVVVVDVATVRVAVVPVFETLDGQRRLRQARGCAVTGTAAVVGAAAAGCRIHVDDIVATFLGHDVRRLDGSVGVCVDGTGVVGHIVRFVGEGIIGVGIRLAAGVVCIKCVIDGNI